MSKKNFIQVFEYQKLRIGDGDFKENHFKSLVKFNEKNGNKYFTPVYNGIQFNSYVGVIKVGGLTIEILPKADRDDSNSDKQKKLWQGVLLNMLRVCKHIQVDTVSETGLKKKNNSILEAYFEIFLSDVEQLVKKGLIKKYRRTENNQLSLKGKLVFSKEIQKNIIHKERFYCEHQVYDRDHQIHQILLQSLTILDSMVSNNLRDRVKRLLFEFDHLSVREFSDFHFRNLNLDRKSQPYEKSLQISKMLILNYSPNLNSGQEKMLTLLFDMNKLWEEYIFRILSRSSQYPHFEITSQAKENFWEHKTIRPDIVLRNTKTEVGKENEVFVIDTKWKIIDNNNPSDDDLKQMFTYNLHWKSSKSILLYPKIEQKDSKFGHYYHEPYRKSNDVFLRVKNQCKIGFLKIVDGDVLRDSEDLVKEIFGKFKDEV